MRLLHIIGSPRAGRSRSRAIADIFVADLKPESAQELDLWSAPLPELDGPMLESRYRLINGQGVDPAFEEKWSELRRIVDHLLSFDLWVFSTPMWNFGVPYRLKHYLDLVIQPTMAFTNDQSGAVTPHGMDKTAVLIGAGALDIRPGATLAPLDFQLAHLEQCLRVYFGVSKVHQIRAAPTFGDDATVNAAMETARYEAQVLAFSLRTRAAGQG